MSCLSLKCRVPGSSYLYLAKLLNIKITIRTTPKRRLVSYGCSGIKCQIQGIQVWQGVGQSVPGALSELKLLYLSDTREQWKHSTLSLRKHYFKSKYKLQSCSGRELLENRVNNSRRYRKNQKCLAILQSYFENSLGSSDTCFKPITVLALCSSGALMRMIDIP